jgi:predicted aspartyl protease
LLTGRVNGDLQAWLTVEIMTPSGQPRPIEVALDTGFNGQIALPAITIQRLELSEESSRLAITATGDRVRLTTYYTTMMWHGEPRIIEVVEADSEPLLGMELLLGNRVTLDVLEGGPVTIYPLS